jgi:hypothetical protein
LPLVLGAFLEPAASSFGPAFLEDLAVDFLLHYLSPGCSLEQAPFELSLRFVGVEATLSFPSLLLQPSAFGSSGFSAVLLPLEGLE